jgi:hypothetical protein
MEKLFVPYEESKALKELGFDEPTPHCYVHDIEEKYELNLFYYLLGGDGELYNVFQNEKKIKSFRLDNVQNESDVYFNYNQDIRKLLVKVYNGEEFVEDEKSYNMNIDSYTYQKWTPEEEEENKLKLPNYNNGDFDFTVYSDIISAPLYSQVFKWFKKKYDIDVNICFRTETEGARVCAYSFEYVYPISHEPRWEGETHDMYLDWVRVSKDVYRYKSSEEAELACLRKLIEITKQK